MVSIVHKGKKFSIDGYLAQNLEIAKVSVKKDWDMLFVIDGMEGSGKSVLGLQMCAYMDETFDLDRIAYTPEEFVDKVKSADKYQAVLYDEAYSGLNSRAALSSVNKALVQMLSEIRQKNLFVVIIQPCFFELDKYVSLWRSRALIHVYTGDNMERGRFAFFNYNKKKTLWIEGKRHYTYNKPPANFIGSFKNSYPVDEVEYRKLKYEALHVKEKERKEGKNDRKMVIMRNLLLAWIDENTQLTQKEMGQICGIGRETVAKAIDNGKKYLENQIKLGRTVNFRMKKVKSLKEITGNVNGVLNYGITPQNP